MTAAGPTALIADDEPLLRSTLTRLLGEAWPELQVVAEARNGREAIEMFEASQPQVCFLDVHMPGLSGVDAARAIGRRASRSSANPAFARWNVTVTSASTTGVDRAPPVRSMRVGVSTASTAHGRPAARA